MKTIFQFISILLISIILTFACYSAEQQESSDPNAIKKFIEYAPVGGIERVEVGYLDWDIFPRTRPIEKSVFPIVMTYDLPAKHLYELKDALEKSELETTEASDIVHFVLRFYDIYQNELLRISLARYSSAIYINDQAYVPNSDLVKSLRYFMPHLAYEQISQSHEYGNYFIEKNEEAQKASKKCNEEN